MPMLDMDHKSEGSGAWLSTQKVLEACLRGCLIIDKEREDDYKAYVKEYMPEKRWFWGKLVLKPAMTFEEAEKYIEDDDNRRFEADLKKKKFKKQHTVLLRLGDFAAELVDLGHDNAWISAQDFSLMAFAWNAEEVEETEET